MADKRLDTVVAEKINASRSFASKLIEEGKVKLGTLILDKPSKKINPDTELNIEFNKNIKYPKLNIKIIFEDKDCLVIDKPSGILTHSKGAFNPEPTIATWLHDKLGLSNEINQRFGIVHRLDRGTSGVMILAKNESTQKFLQKQFAKRNVKKTYTALVEDSLNPKKAIIDIPVVRNSADPKRFKVSIYGKPALTSYEVRSKFSYHDRKFSLVELKPTTGRTHQIRLHLQYLKSPIVGDNFYGGLDADRLYLHATNLELTLPNSTRKEYTSTLPKEFLKPRIDT